MTAPLLEVRGLTKRFGGVTAVENLSFDVNAGEILALIGPNGAGKTTVFNLITRVLEPSGGEVRFAGRPVLPLQQNQLASLGMTRTFQNLQLFADLTVLENVMVGYHTRMQTGFLAAMLRLPGAAREDRLAQGAAMAQLERVGLGGRALDRAGSLPYGQQRLVEIARCLAASPKLILLDEPMAGLTVGEKRALGELMLALRGEGLTFLFVEHDMPAVISLADRIVALQFGTMLAQGTPAEIQRDPQVLAAYLGEEAI